jgi:hypothetical protein
MLLNPFMALPMVFMVLEEALQHIMEIIQFLAAAAQAGMANNNMQEVQVVKPQMMVQLILEAVEVLALVAQEALVKSL